MTIIQALKDEELSDEERRRSIFSGNLFVYSPRTSSLALAAAASRLIESMLGPDPVDAQQRISPAAFAALFSVAAQILQSVSMDVVCAVVADYGCDPETTFVGAPTLAAVTGLGFLAHGLGIAQHPHRDTWYAATPLQVNWIVPLHDLESSTAFAFHPTYWDTPVHNSSRDFDYDAWAVRNRSGRLIVQDPDPLAQPRPLRPINLSAEVRIGCPAGGMIMASAAHLYSAGPNETERTQFSVHFQTLSQVDIERGDGPVNIDAEPVGTSLRNFVRCSDLSPISSELVRSALDAGTPLATAGDFSH